MINKSHTKLPCSYCGSSDAGVEYADGFYCFSCKTSTRTSHIREGRPDKHKTVVSLFKPDGKAVDVPTRALNKATLEYYGVLGECSTASGEVVKLHFPVFRGGKQVGTKTKELATKKFIGHGSTKSPDLFGADKCGEGGKLLIITEGEEDCMSAHQLLRQVDKRYNVVSLPNGANTTSIRRSLEWIETFETIILNLDNDKVGIECAQEIAETLTPGKVKIMTLPFKDANEFLIAKHGGTEYLSYLWKAKPHRPDGVVSLADDWDDMWADDDRPSVPYPWAGLNEMLYGLRSREIVTLTGGTGIGKSAIIRELEHHLLKTTDDKIGILALEESVRRTKWGVVAVEANLPLAINEERVKLLASGEVTKEDIKRWYDNTLGLDRLFALDHWGSTSETHLLNRIRYMIRGLGCKWIVLDHLSIVVSAMESMGDERKAIDSIMTRLRQICEETDAGMLLVSHLRRIDGNKGHEQGVEVGLSHLRGSQAIAQLSDAVVAIERNQQADDVKEANLTMLRVLKNRYAGLTGLAASLGYDRATGRMFEVKDVAEYLAPSPTEVDC